MNKKRKTIETKEYYDLNFKVFKVRKEFCIR